MISHRANAGKHSFADRGADLLAALSYEPDTGIFRWKINRANKKAGDIAGNVGPNGYRTIMVSYQSYYAHHLALMFAGKTIPKGFHVDHINGDKSDNRIENLRITTPSNNGLNRLRSNKNNTSGVSGVIRTRSGKYLAFIVINRKRRRLGLFKSFAEAKGAREAALIRELDLCR